MAQTTYILPTKLKKFKLITPIIIGDELLLNFGAKFLH